MENNLTTKQNSKLNYDGELTLEALSVLDIYSKECCNTAATARKLNRSFIRVKKYLNQPYVRELFKLRLMQKGVTPEKIADTIHNGLNAVNGIYYEGNKVTDEPNWSARQRFAQLAAEIFEVLKYQVKQDGALAISNIIYNINPKILSDNERKMIEGNKCP
jgi:hypothetical protein